MKKKLYPLTASQLIHYRWIKQYHTQQVAGISVVASLQIQLDFELLQKCIRMEIERCECLRVRFTKPDSKGSISQYIVNSDDRDIPFVDLSNMSMNKADEIMQKWAYETLDLTDSPMFTVTMLKLPDNYYGFFLHVDHRLLDSAGIIIMMNDLMELYCHYSFNTPFPDAPASYTETLEQDIRRATTPHRFNDDKNFWDNLLDKYGEPLYSDIQGKEVLENSRKKHHNDTLRSADIEMDNLKVAVKDFYLETDSSNRLIDFCKNNKISMTNLLLLGLRTYLSKVNDRQEDITIENFVSRRVTPKQWTSGSSRTMMFPCRTVIPSSTSFINAANIVQDMQNHVYMHCNYDPALIQEEIQKRYHTPDNTTYESVYLTYQPLPSKAMNPIIASIPQHSIWFANGAATKKLYLTVSHTGSGEMQFSFHYQVAHLNDHDMELVYYYLMRILFAGIGSPEKEVDEIISEV